MALKVEEEAMSQTMQGMKFYKLEKARNWILF